jgi:tripartite-type tricarboxylate transporter receptor subunit TctC
MERILQAARSAAVGAKRVVLSLAAALLVAGLAVPAHAQSFPSRPIKLVLPFAPGGGFDGIARPFAERLSQTIGQPVIVENRPGAGGNIAAEYVARSAPDGYTLFFSNELLVTNPLIYQTVAFDALKDFVPVARVGSGPNAIAINPNVPAKDLRELMALAKKQRIHYGTSGIGSTVHLLGEMLSLDGTMPMVHVPYKGTGPAVVDTISGQIEVVMGSLPTLAPHIKAGKLRGIAVMSGKRNASMPDLPTIAEAGLPGVEVDLWYGVFAPAGTPDSIVRTINDAAVKALAQPDLVDRLQKAGYEVGSSTPEALGQVLRADLKRWERVARDARIPKQ